MTARLPSNGAHVVQLPGVSSEDAGRAALAAMPALTAHLDTLSREVNGFVRVVRETQTEHAKAIDNITTAILCEVPQAAKTAHEAGKMAQDASARVARVASDVARMRDAIGNPPRDPAALARESQRDMTREEIEALEAGTGLAGDVAKLKIHVDQLWRRGRWYVVAGAAVTALSPHAPEILRAIFGG